jgi:hypothetical protein
MDSTATAQAQQKFSNLRRRLDQLGYQQPLGVESLPLVEKLFADLVHTTESLKNAKLQLGQKKEETTDAEAAAAPYRSDNARLIKENNDLHMQLIKQKEEADMVARGVWSTVDLHICCDVIMCQLVLVRVHMCVCVHGQKLMVMIKNRKTVRC